MPPSGPLWRGDSILDPTFQTQPAPEIKPPENKHVWEFVWEKWWFPRGLRRATAYRCLNGIQKYGTSLQPFNGRNAVQDAVEENMDHLAYVEQLAQEGRLSQMLCTLLQLLDIFSMWVLLTFSKKV